MVPEKTANPYVQTGGQTPGWGMQGRTPSHHPGDGRTPAWNASSHTPNPWADGGKTPAWNVSSRTPNPYDGGRNDGGRTPGWSSRTPNPYLGGSAGGSGGGWGGATPGRTWGGATPQAPRESGSEWGASGTWAEEANTSAQTPGVISAATPAAAVFYPTPAPGPKTPASYAALRANEASSAPTPGFGSGIYSAAGRPGKELSDRWLADPICSEICPPKKIAVELKGTRNSNQSWFLEGELEGRTGYVLSILQAPTSSTATVQLDEPLPGTPNVYPPIKYLVPVEPEKKDLALVLEGPYKGQVGTVDVKGDDGNCVLKRMDHSFIDAMVEQLVKLHPAPA
jgi:transcription elongation factor SPT5